jgi:predicted Zn-dependent protease
MLGRNALRPSPLRIIPFVKPWLLGDADLFVLPGNTKAKLAAIAAVPKGYTLLPDPLNSPLASDSPDADDWAYLPELPTSRHLSTAQRLANESQAASAAHIHPVSAKYDVTRIGTREVGGGVNFYSIEKEQALGKQLSYEVEQGARLLSDPVVTEYVNRTGQTLVRHSDCQVAFEIKVVDDEEVNAFALPGGFFYVNTGLILAADNEAELAGVMAHEIAHVCARHATRNATRGQISQIASIPLIFVGGPVGFAVRELSSVAMPLSFLKFSRDAEREADLLGMQYQYSSGYDPTAFVDFFEKLEAEQEGRENLVSRAFSTHPMNSDRVHRAEQMLELLPARDTYITNTSEFDEVRARLANLTYGRVVGGNHKPHPTLRTRRPQ